MSTLINIVDIEATCWDNDQDKKDNKSEVIEIGIVQLNTETGEVIDSQGILIIPKTSQVSVFCTELTTITQELLIEQAVSYESACDIIVNRFSGQKLPWASYGRYDYSKLVSQSKDYGAIFPLSHDHTNVKDLVSYFFKCKPVGMARALQMCKLSLEGTHHRGIDDALNIARIYTKISL